jgi:AcrR family transcriptional regulator
MISDSPPLPTKPEVTDGRRRRSLDSRARIVAAVLSLIREGELEPSVELVAERAGVGLRTAFRHLSDMESLYREVSEVVETEMRALAARPFRSEGWRDRIVEMVGRRRDGFEVLGPFRLASDLRRHASSVLQDDRERLTGALRLILLHELAPSGIDATTIEALDLLLSYESWSRLRREQGLDPAAAEQVLQRAVRALIGD